MAREVESFRDIFYTALLDAPHLNTLGLTILPNSYDDLMLGDCVFSDIMLVITEGHGNWQKVTRVAPRLRNLELNRHHINLYHLYDFVYDRRETMRRVDLRNIKHTPLEWEVLADMTPGETIALHETVLTGFERSMPQCKWTRLRAYDGEEWKGESCHEVWV